MHPARHLRWGRGAGEAAHPRALAVGLGAGWIWPAWLERQSDPRSPAFVAGPPVNVTARNATAIGNIASSRRAVVDSRGLVTPWPGGWSLDWWIGADDRWHFPSRELAVRQGLVGGAPVVETLMRIPSGDAAARAYAVVGEAGLGDLAMVEVENRSPVPVAVAFALRPFNGDGLAEVEHIELTGDRVVSVHGSPALILPRAPSAAAGRSFAEGDVAGWVSAGGSTIELTAVDCELGLATAAVVFPLAHGATIRVALPLAAGLVLEPDHVPHPSFAAPAVARAWEVQARRGVQVVLPAGRLGQVFEANRKYVLESFGGDRVVATPSSPGRGRPEHSTAVLVALDRLGFHAEAAEVLVGTPERQRFDGSFEPGDSATAETICALADHWRLARDEEVLRHTLPAVALAARWLERARSARRHGGLLPTISGPPELGPSPNLYWSSFRAARALLDAAELLEAGGEARPAAVCADRAASLRADIERSLDGRPGSLVIPAGPDRGIDGGVIGSLAAAGVLGADDPRVVATVGEIAARFCAGPAVFQTMGLIGLGPAATARLAGVELAQGSTDQALERVRWLVDAASATSTWPEAIHPILGGGSAGEGHSAVAGAAFVTLVLDLLAGDVDDGIAICRAFPTEWEGQAVEVHDAPGRWGRVSFAVRWHGDRPALLWDVVAHEGVDQVRITAPGLDPTWSTTEPKGETMLRHPSPAATAELF